MEKEISLSEKKDSMPRSIDELELSIKEKIRDFINKNQDVEYRNKAESSLTEKPGSNIEGEGLKKIKKAFYLGRLTFITVLGQNCYGFGQERYASLSDDDKEKFNKLNEMISQLQESYSASLTTLEKETDINVENQQKLNQKWQDLIKFTEEKS